MQRYAGRRSHRAHPDQKAVIAVRNVDEVNLAWALIGAAKPHLSADERNKAFVTVGAGDTFAAIHQLIKLAANKQISLQPQLAQLCTRWLRAYVLHEEYEQLRHLVEGFVIPNSLQAAKAVRRLPSAPRASAPLTVTGRARTMYVDRSAARGALR
jgi:hypothetical protein